MSDKKNEKTIVESIWDFLASVKLAVLIFTAIASTSVVGTVIEQGAAPETNLTLLSKFVGDSMAPQAYKLLDMLGFMDMYRSWWFIGLLMLFAINLIICSLERIPRAWRAATEKMKPLKDEQFGTFPVKSQVMIEGTAEENRHAIASAMKSAGFSKPEQAEVEGGYQLFSSKQGMSRMGVYITHLSLLVILIGAIVGVMLGFKGNLYLMEGETSAAALTYQARGPEVDTVTQALLHNNADVAAAAASFDRSPESFMDRAQEIGVDPLGFLIKCENSAVDFYPRSYSPKEYSSNLTVMDTSGAVILKKKIEVNDPLKFRGYTFYQSNHGLQARQIRQTTDGKTFYGPYEPFTHPDFIFDVTPPGGTTTQISAKWQTPFTLPGSEITAKVVSFVPTSGGSQQQQNTMSNLVVQLEINDPKNGTYTYSAPKRFDQTPLRDGTRIKPVDIWGVEYTGLSVRRDPGVWIVYLGCIIMSVGLYMAFFMSHRRLWVQAVNSNGKTSLRIAGTAHKHRESFEIKVQKTLGSLSEGGK